MAMMMGEGAVIRSVVLVCGLVTSSVLLLPWWLPRFAPSTLPLLRTPSPGRLRFSPRPLFHSEAHRIGLLP